MIKVLVNGAKGRMGQETVRAVEADPELKLVAQTDAGDDLRQVLKSSGAKVAIDFTSVDAGFENARTMLESRVRPVIGTSGFTKAEVEELQHIARQYGVGGVIAPNFAIGAVLMMKFAAEAAKYLPQAEVLELHHDRKADSPSGTAIRTAELIANGRETLPPELTDKPVIPHARGATLDHVHVHSMRLQGVVAQQIVWFGGVGQTLRIEHNSINRESFMPGVCLACKKVMEVDELVYGLENLL